MTAPAALKVDRTIKGRLKNRRVAAKKNTSSRKVAWGKDTNPATHDTAGVIYGVALTKVAPTLAWGTGGGDEGTVPETGSGDTEMTCLQDQGCDSDRRSTSTSTKRQHDKHSTPMDRDEALNLLLYFLKNH